MKMTKPQNSHRKLRVRLSALTATLLSVVCGIVFFANTVSAQNLRRQMRIQKRIDRKLNPPGGNQNRPSPPSRTNEEPVESNQFEATEAKTAPRTGGKSMAGIRHRHITCVF